MTLFSEMLKDFSPVHELQFTILVSTFACGCQTSITFAGRPSRNKKEGSFLSVGNGSLWSDSSTCTHGHLVSFDEISNCSSISAVHLVAEINGFNSIEVSSQLKKTA